VREVVYDVAVWAGGGCAESAGVAVCVGSCCEAGWWEAALCCFGDDVCASWRRRCAFACSCGEVG
jgi:hypothetical protein